MNATISASAMRKFPVTVGCKYCLKNDECELQEAVQFVGLEKIRYQTSFRNMPVLREPFFDRNYNLCILCGRCVRTCAGGEGRGCSVQQPRFSSQPLDRARITAGLQTANFAVPALMPAPPAPSYARFEKWQRPTETISTVCPYCGVGCRMDLGVLDGRLVRVRGKRDCLPNFGQLCVKGRFGLGFVDSPERLTVPLIRKNGRLGAGDLGGGSRSGGRRN